MSFPIVEHTLEMRSFVDDVIDTFPSTIDNSASSWEEDERYQLQYCIATNITAMKLIVDSHLDLAWNALILNRELTRPLAEINASEAESTDGPFRGHATTALPEMRAGSVCLCLGTLVAGVSSQGGLARFTFSSVDIANSIAVGQLNYYERLAARDEVRLILNQGHLKTHVSQWSADDTDARQFLPIGMIVAFEGCDSVTTPDEACLWFSRGVRCASLVHDGHGRYSGGTGTTASLNDAGRALLHEFERLGILLDVTHLSDEAFQQVADTYMRPLFASHQNCRALVPRPRQLPTPSCNGRAQLLGATLPTQLKTFHRRSRTKARGSSSTRKANCPNRRLGILEPNRECKTTNSTTTKRTSSAPVQG
jgi:microsomal dipeptidase-like Zn-dependent dipeptidase